MIALRKAIQGLGRFNEAFAKVARLIARTRIAVMTASRTLRVACCFFDRSQRWRVESRKSGP